ncbi:thiamine phosphate synthase [Wenzhouxiangella sp. AB-CW3]|uniref:thiamine phosphate synthase n=1 Tax=Wenzhouxiangella sp. AB-CW3 TaxID=2771012 RepID=UPI00168C0BA6|nr:thiamine phosphate synthase [Wenzhouxiangella sp. AB-CW3]QOC22588.1 thiamine phosphate synthase [Wenzhouxiangella sp. AB-CW3]
MNDKRDFLKRGLYAVTPANRAPAQLLPDAEAALAGGVRLLQYRAKPRPDPDVARELLKLCRRNGAALIINDDIELAAILDAHGVHLGRDDARPERAREALGPDAIIGVSCYNDLDRAREMLAAEPDYLAFGSVFASPTKPDAVNCPPDVITAARDLGLPVTAIGGITLDNAPTVIDAGADLLAVITDLFDADNIEQRARQFQELFSS